MRGHRSIRSLLVALALFGALALPGTVAAAEVTVQIERVTRDPLVADVTVTCAEEQYVDVQFTLSQPRLTAKRPDPRSIAFTNFTVQGFCGPTPTTVTGGLDSFGEPFRPGVAWVTHYSVNVCETDFTGCERVPLADRTVRLAR
jgi:hypothetical protein